MTPPIVIPFRPVDPKKRLKAIMSQEEREGFARAMLSDVIETVIDAGCTPVLLTTQEIANIDARVRVIVLNLGLNEALDAFRKEQDGPFGIVMADLALCNTKSLMQLAHTSAAFGIVPGTGGGTNAIYIKDGSAFKAQYYGFSFLKHLTWAKEQGYSIEIIDSFRLSTDIDEPDDLVEVLIHTERNTAAYLNQIGFVLCAEEGRVHVKRI
ncbi:MAG: 2-phospho-L-lactate guanylyltransferase [Methanomicrobiales archaeon]|jgi:2-phospho-L-lactate guanylyltransferase|nr:2-phospho-L-lactate guanylyltransferase [Methanomicrobiales archaeon]